MVSNNMNKPSKISFAIIGFGLFAEKSLIPGFKESKMAQLMAITKQDAEEVKKKASIYNIPHGYAYRDRNEIYKNTDIKAIYVAGTNNNHIIDTLEALDHGKHVIVEKPMALNSVECQQMIDCAKKNNRKLMVAHCMRFVSAVEHIREICSSGKLGKIVSIIAEFYSDASKSQRKWKYNKKVAGGGAAFDLGVHMIDTIRFLANSNLSHVSIASLPEKIDEDTVDDVSSFQMKFENGIVGYAMATYIGSRNTYLEVFGEKGYIRAYDWNNVDTKVRIESEIEGDFKAYKIHNENHYAKMLDAFSDAIMNNKPVPIPGEEGLINQKIIDAVNK
jgi:predicted dehydrogenase